MRLLLRYIRHPDETYSIDDEQNLILLRKDLHYLFDQRRFTFVAKSAISGNRHVDRIDIQCQLIPQVLLPQGSTELIRLYHHRTLYAVTGVSAELLFARFAWSLFTDAIVTFFRGVQEVPVLTFDPQAGKQRIKNLCSSQVRKESMLFGSYSRSRSVSPRKRTIDETSQQNRRTYGRWRRGVDNDGYSDGEEFRGRRRERSSSGSDVLQGLSPSLSRSFPSDSTPDTPFMASINGPRTNEPTQKDCLIESATYPDSLEEQRQWKRCRIV